MSSYQIKRAGQRLFRTVKKPKMIQTSNQDFVMPIEFSAWSYAFDHEGVKSEDLREGYVLAAVYFAEKDKEQKTDLSADKTEANQAVCQICIDQFEPQIEAGTLSKEKAIGLLARLVDSVDFAEKHYGHDGYLKHTARPFRGPIQKAIQNSASK